MQLYPELLLKSDEMSNNFFFRLRNIILLLYHLQSEDLIYRQKIPKQIRNKHEGIDNSVNYRNDFFVLINKLAETTKRLLPTDMSTCYVSTTLPYRIYLSSIFKEDILLSILPNINDLKINNDI